MTFLTTYFDVEWLALGAWCLLFAVALVEQERRKPVSR